MICKPFVLYLYLKTVLLIVFIEKNHLTFNQQIMI